MASIQKECPGMQAMITSKFTNGTDKISTYTGGMISIRLTARDGKEQMDGATVVTHLLTMQVKSALMMVLFISNLSPCHGQTRLKKIIKSSGSEISCRHNYNQHQSTSEASFN